jgi:hypothetical protein
MNTKKSAEMVVQKKKKKKSTEINYKKAENK